MAQVNINTFVNMQNDFTVLLMSKLRDIKKMKCCGITKDVIFSAENKILQCMKSIIDIQKFEIHSST